MTFDVTLRTYSFVCYNCWHGNGVYLLVDVFVCCLVMWLLVMHYLWLKC